MTGDRSRRLFREEMEQRFYRLRQFLGCYLHEDWPEESGTPESAVDRAISEYPIEFLQQTRRELAIVLAENADDTRLRDVLTDSLGVKVYFGNAGEARAFAESVEQRLMNAIKTHFEGSRVKG